MGFPEFDLIGKWLGNYRVVQGGLARPFCAHDPFLNRYVAITLFRVPPNATDDFTLRFQRESNVLRDLDHPNILPVYDSGYSDNYLYRVLELSSAGSLGEQLKQGPLPVQEAGRILRQLASALDATHAERIFHGDIKPGNVLLDRQRERARLVGFGPPRLPRTILGTLAYMAPELFELQNIDARAEVYSLGVLVFEMLSGKLPFDASSPSSLLATHRDKTQPPALDVLGPDVPRRAVAAVEKAISRRATSRFATAGEFAEAWPDNRLL